MGEHTNYRWEFNSLIFLHLSFLSVPPFFFSIVSFSELRLSTPRFVYVFWALPFFQASFFRWTWWKSLIFQFVRVVFLNFIFSLSSVCWFCPMSLLHQIQGQPLRDTAIACLQTSDSWHLVGTVSPFLSSSDTSYSINYALSNRCGRVWRLEYKQLHLNTQTAGKGRKWTQ